MIGVLLLTNHRLAEIFLENAIAIVGEAENARAISQKPSMNFQSLHDEVAQAIETLNQGDGVLVLVDIFGSTPCNAARAFLDIAPIAIVAGLNMAMLLKVLEADRTTLSLEALALYAADSAKNSVSMKIGDFRAAEATVETEKEMNIATDEAERTVTVVNSLGLHASTSAKLVKEAGRFASEITLSNAGLEINVKSIMGVLMLGAAKGTRLKLAAKGEDASQAVFALAKMFEEGFGED